MPNSTEPTPRKFETADNLRAFGTWSEAEAHFRGLLYTALSRLASQGFVTALDEARDLILDFFLEEWAGLVARYNPAYSRPHTYVYRAFVLFARPKILRLKRWKNSLTDVSTLSRQTFDECASTAESLDVGLVRDALDHLPADERDALQSLLIEKTSLTKLAGRQGITRYQARELLCDALGRVLVELGERGALTELEWQAALAVWRDGKSPRDAARDLGTSAAEIQVCRTKVLNIIGRGVRAANRRTKKPLQRQGVMIMPHIADIVRSAILGHSPQAWTDLRKRREEVLKFLDEDDLRLSLEEEDILDKRPETLVRLLETLGENLDDYLSPSERESAEALIRAQQNDEELVGSAFMHVLLPSLSDDLLRFDKWFVDIHAIGDAERAELLSRTDVRAANKDGDYPNGLLKYGITPLTVLYASQSARNVYDDLLRAERIDDKHPIRLTGIANAKSTLPVESVAREIGMLVECDMAMANALYRFCFAIALDDHPYFWEGFNAEPEQDSELSLSLMDRIELGERWRALALAHA